MEVRPATAGERPAVATILDAGLLETDALADRIEAGDVLVAVEADRVLGALVVEPPERAPSWARERGTDAHVTAVAVRRRRRGLGIGSTLVEAAGARGTLTAAFDPGLRAFYVGLGFLVEAGPDGRLRGVRKSG